MVKTLAKKKTMKTKVKARPSKGKVMKSKLKKTISKRATVKKVMKKVTKKLVKKISAKKKPSKAKKAAMPGMLGKVVHYYDRIGVAIVELSAPIMVGDLVTFRRGEREFMQPVGSIEINHQSVEKAGKGKVIGVKVVQPADQGTLVLRG